MKKRGCLIVAALVASLVVAYLGYLQSTDFWAADTCADRGGSYHFDRRECSFTENYRGEVPSLSPF